MARRCTVHRGSGRRSHLTSLPTSLRTLLSIVRSSRLELTSSWRYLQSILHCSILLKQCVDTGVTEQCREWTGHGTVSQGLQEAQWVECVQANSQPFQENYYLLRSWPNIPSFMSLKYICCHQQYLTILYIVRYLYGGWFDLNIFCRHFSEPCHLSRTLLKASQY